MQSYFNHSSQRLDFRKLTEGDIPHWEQFFVDNDRLRFFGFENKSNIELSTDWINMQLKRYEESGLGMLAVIEKSSGDLIGLCGIIPREFEGKMIYEIGYSLMQSHWGKGYATEAATHMRRIGNQLGISSLFVSTIHPENVDSMKVAERNGMKRLKNGVFNEMELVIFGDEGAV
jgi:RimJ/RimL family protein N-acetyltransferase